MLRTALLMLSRSRRLREAVAGWPALRPAPGAIGIVLQAYLYRAAKDLERLLPLGPNVRLVKGAFLESPGVAYRRRRDVDANFRRLAARLVEVDALARGVYPAFATHDEALLTWLTPRLADLGVPRDRFEFRMLLGVRRDLQERLTANGYRVRVYVPFGTFWYPYFVRRLAERPANLFFVLRNVLRA